jgi:hypothetical protein
MPLCIYADAGNLAEACSKLTRKRPLLLNRASEILRLKNVMCDNMSLAITLSWPRG